MICSILPVDGNAQFRFTRFERNPIITPSLLPGIDGENINGPSLVKVPDWVTGALGKYYLYFAHHQGAYIRLAYANDLKGPWKIYTPGSLNFGECSCIKHIASPDVHINSEDRQIVMYFHCPTGEKGQRTFRAVSTDGIHFLPDTVALGAPYFRVFRWNGVTYALARKGILYRSLDGSRTFEEGNNPFDAVQTDSNYLRHAAVKVHGEKLLVFYSRIGDTPERILLSNIELTGNWKEWTASAPVTLAYPTTEYEGAMLPAITSTSGAFHGLVRQLRDPAFYEENGKWYLLYSVGGENGIGIAELDHTQ
ncbi:MAG: hypothetical protein LBS09_06130 [Bacteroidales bacterium]|nr:hypothetical protein [Bacteroidales bacterium]